MQFICCCGARKYQHNESLKFKLFENEKLKALDPLSTAENFIVFPDNQLGELNDV